MSPAKRAFDLTIALLLVPFVVPAVCIIALMIALRDGRPVFYVAERMRTPQIGFGLWKFRTMRVVEADAGVSGGDKADRITPNGRWLRARRLDELPQLWNILRGDLSFVGPRPPLREYVERFPELYGDVLRSRPGITGLATVVYHRHEAMLLARSPSAEQTDRIYANHCVPRKAHLDMIYQRRASLCFDIVLMLRTVGAVVAHRGPRRR